jgi:hypothetical protein
LFVISVVIFTIFIFKGNKNKWIHQKQPL